MRRFFAPISPLSDFEALLPSFAASYLFAYYFRAPGIKRAAKNDVKIATIAME